jgi:hypothetical protein
VADQTLSEWMHWMVAGQFERAWEVGDRARPVPQLSDVRGKTVLLRCENGLGDSIQFIRYARLLKPLVSRILVHVQPRLLPVVSAIPEVDWAFAWGDRWPKGRYDYEINVMHLPHMFRTTVATVPSEVPYLAVDAGLAAAYRAEIRQSGRFHVGLQVSCGDTDMNRALPRERVFAAIGGTPGVEAVDLERYGATPDVTHTGAAIMALDLVITPDTMVAHLAGALGRPVWVLLPRRADWRWMSGRRDSPWYPTMRLFRQDDSRGWGPVLEQVVAELGKEIEPEYR